MTKPTTVKMLRERLCQGQRRGDPIEAIQQALIDLCDILRPLGPDGTHGDRHTPLCGCDPDHVVEQELTPDLSTFEDAAASPVALCQSTGGDFWKTPCAEVRRLSDAYEEAGGRALVPSGIAGFCVGDRVRIMRNHDRYDHGDYNGREATVMTLDHDHGYRLWVLVSDAPEPLNDASAVALYVDPDDIAPLGYTAATPSAPAPNESAIGRDIRKLAADLGSDQQFTAAILNGFAVRADRLDAERWSLRQRVVDIRIDIDTIAGDLRTRAATKAAPALIVAADALDELASLREPAPDREALAEQGRRLASIREGLIASGVDPAELPIPLHPGGTFTPDEAHAPSFWPTHPAMPQTPNSTKENDPDA